MPSKRDNVKRWQIGLRSVFIAVLVIAVLLSGLLAFNRLQKHAIIDARVQSLDVGMTKAEVLDRLSFGKPRLTGDSEWTYHWPQRGTVVILFDEQGRVKRIANK